MSKTPSAGDIRKSAPQSDKPIESSFPQPRAGYSREDRLSHSQALGLLCPIRCSIAHMLTGEWMPDDQIRISSQDQPHVREGG